MHAKNEWRLAMNRPTPDPSQEGSMRSSVSCQFPSWEGFRGGFMVLMRANNCLESAHEFES